MQYSVPNPLPSLFAASFPLTALAFSQPTKVKVTNFEFHIQKRCKIPIIIGIYLSLLNIQQQVQIHKNKLTVLNWFMMENMNCR